MSGNLVERLEFHANAEAHKYTAKADDWGLFHTILCVSKKQAMRIESHIKKMKSATYIRNLKKYPEMNEKLLLKY